MNSQSFNSFPSNNHHNHNNQQYTNFGSANYSYSTNNQANQNSDDFTEKDKAMLQSLLHLDKELLDLYNDIRNVNKKDYPMFPKCDKSGMVTPDEYRAWRRAFLVQLQSD